MKSYFARFKPVADYGRDSSGVAAVEFALIVPILLALFLGGIEYSRATMYARRFNQVTAMASDLIAREAQLDDAKLLGISQAIDTAWGNLDNHDSLRLQVKHVRSAGNLATKKAPGTTYVEWSYPIRENKKYPDCQDYTVPVANMVQRGNSVVIVTATYTYRSLFNGQAPGMSTATLDWQSESSHAPRDLCVAYDKTNCLSTCE